MRRRLVGLVIIALAGCSSGQAPSVTSSAVLDESTTEPSNTATTDAPTDGAPTTEASSSTEPDSTETPPLAWAPCDELDAAECATLAVPLDHSDPAGTTIDIALARVPASDPAARIGSLVFNPGGPGGSGLDLLEFLPFTIPPDVAERFDIVSFDPRGVGASASVECDITLDDGVALVADGDRAAWDELLDVTRTELATCTTDVDGLDALVGTNNAARDLDLIRAALGDEQLSYVGFSYGTRLGATYAELFPDRVRALVLDGAVKPTQDLDEIGAEQGPGFDRAFENFAAACDADADCLLRELGATLDVVADVRAEIAEVGSFDTDDPDRVLTPGELDLGILAALYSKASWPFLAEAIYLADTEADGTLFQVLTDSYLGRELDGSYSNQTEAGGFINCADDADRPDVETTFVEADAVADRSQYFATLLRASSGCLGIPDAVDPLVLGPATGAAPILVIGTTGDPATPYEWAVEMAEFLDSGVLYTVEGEGHTAYTSIDCVAPIVGAYLIDLEVPAAGDSCVDDAGSDFFVPAGDSEVDQIIAFFDCLIEEGAPIEPVTVADILADPTGEELFGDLDVNDPTFGAAVIACSDLIPG